MVLLHRDQNWQCTCEQNRWIGADDENAVEDFFDECLCQIPLSSAGKIKKEKDCRVVPDKSKKKITTTEKKGHFVQKQATQVQSVKALTRKFPPLQIQKLGQNFEKKKKKKNH